jgi:branched-chain amino acid transport system ATP-binding protein
MMLEMRNVSKSFGGLRAVHNVSFQINEGEIVGLIGPNGAGKTTLFNLVTGVYPVDGGEVLFEGRSIIGETPDRVCHRGIGRTFQIVKPFGKMTVLQNVMVGAFCRVNGFDEAREVALEILDFIKLMDLKDNPARSLTIGSRKRLEIARALATRPRLLLLDEVVAGLNPTEANETMEMIDKIRESGITLFWVEHVMAAVMELSERIIVLHHGERIAEGSPEEVSRDQGVIQAYLGEEYHYA